MTIIHRPNFYILITFLCITAFIVSCEEPFSPTASQPSFGSWQSMESGTTIDLNSVWGSSSTDVYAVGDSGIVLHYNGVEWSRVDVNSTNKIYDIWGSSSDNIFIIGQTLFKQFDGTTWADFPEEIVGLKITGCSESEFIISSSDAIAYKDGDWDTLTSSSGREIWCNCNMIHPVLSQTKGQIVIGWERSIKFWNGAEWATLGIRPINTVYGIWGTNLSNVYLCGNFGRIAHFDGRQCRMVSYSWGTDSHLYDMDGFSDNNITAVGENGHCVHFNGIFWSQSNTGTTTQLNKVWYAPDGTVFAVGNVGTILINE